MQMDMLPVGEFAFNVEITFNEILNTPNDASVGYFLEVDLNYPVHLHDDHQDFPLAPTKETVQDEWLGEYQMELKEQHRLPSSKVKKLLQTLFDKKKLCIALQTSQIICYSWVNCCESTPCPTVQTSELVSTLYFTEQ